MQTCFRIELLLRQAGDRIRTGSQSLEGSCAARNTSPACCPRMVLSQRSPIRCRRGTLPPLLHRNRARFVDEARRWPRAGPVVARAVEGHRRAVECAPERGREQRHEPCVLGGLPLTLEGELAGRCRPSGILTASPAPG